ncbi:MAG: glutamate synthase subunit beta [Planctomycetota bacterium]
MGKPTGFLDYAREAPPKRPPAERVRDWRETDVPLPEEALQNQAARCMDCGVPFCHWACPLSNQTPEVNDLVYRGRWREALVLLHRGNNFPELTGRLCPALCEGSCVLGIQRPAVTACAIELQVVERGWREGWITPCPPRARTGRRAAIVGSGPAGLACAQQLARAGHDVFVFERSDRPGGILRYGIPDFKLEKRVLDRRLDQLAAEGVRFVSNAEAGVSPSAADLRSGFDAIALCGGAGRPRDLDVPGRDLAGVRFAMDFLARANRRQAGDEAADPITAKGLRVVILGGGDTGADCLATALRQGAASVRQLEILPKPPESRAEANPWPEWPNILRVSYAHEEGGVREFSVRTTRLEGVAGAVKRVCAVRLEWQPQPSGPPRPRDIPGSEFALDADFVILAMGFLGPEKGPLASDLGVRLTDRTTVWTDAEKQTSVPGVFAAGDMARGPSLVAWAIAEGRAAARGIDAFLLGEAGA